MNKLTKLGLLFQIPNAILLIGVMFYLIIFKINWSLINLNIIALIVFGSLYAIINVVSIILLISGIDKK